MMVFTFAGMTVHVHRNTHEELYILFRRTYQCLSQAGVHIHRNYIGEYATSLKMAGASITMMRLDDELKELIDDPASSPFFRQ